MDETGASQLKWSPSTADAPLDREAPARLPDAYHDDVLDLTDRVFAYQATQRPVRKLRYPRAAESNNNKTSRGGNVWFKTHASPSKTGEKGSDAPRGLTVLRTRGALAQRLGKSQVAAQPLPPFDPRNPFDDVLYGYDLVATDVLVENNARMIGGLEAFDPTRHARANERSGPNTSPSADTRRRDRDQR